MARKYVPDPLAMARAMADTRIRQLGVSKGAGADAVNRDELVEAYLPTATAIAKGLARAWDGVSAGDGSITGDGSAGKLLKKNAKSVKKLNRKLKRFAEAERLRLQAQAEHQAHIRTMAAQAPSPSQAPRWTPADVAKFRLAMDLAARGEAQWAEEIRKSGGGRRQEGTTNGQGQS